MEKKHFLSSVWAKFYNNNKKLFKRGDRVVVGVSGGADSVVLLDFLAKLAQKNRFSLYACHVNHGLRAAAVKDEKFTQRFCDSLGVECFVVRKNVKELAKKEKLSIEHAARKARYQAFEEVCKKTKANYIAVAHHLDDHVETILLNILRGTRAKGLMGIARERPLNKQVTIVRPLLGVRRADVEAYIKFNKLKYVTDETNDDDKYTRNWVRKNLLPVLEHKQPQIREHLNLISEDLRRVLRED
ncbi:tRNA(Ile)-lysidine synthase [Elusimicrobium simillimum]|uniref:tRNA lysidine(34) synthetase TilS n=1 Tax=Elusimicrobium simillimum TaxID=3143438 RepID=UPI003C6F4F71